MRLHDDTNDPVDIDTEILISRLIDGEAKQDDERHFEQLAAGEPSLWRRLAVRQRDMLLLADQVQARTQCADTVDLHRMSILPHRLTWPLAMSGWAAVLILALTWGAVVMYSGWRDRGVEEISKPGMLPFPTMPRELSRREYLKEYEQAEWVLGEMQAIMLQWQRLDDGSVELSYLRRLHEQIVLDPELASELIADIERKIESNETVTFDADYLDELRARQRERTGPTGADPGSS